MMEWSLYVRHVMRGSTVHVTTLWRGNPLFHRLFVGARDGHPSFFVGGRRLWVVLLIAGDTKAATMLMRAVRRLTRSISLESSQLKRVLTSTNLLVDLPNLCTPRVNRS
jgi:hypothetical protein